MERGQGPRLLAAVSPPALPRGDGGLELTRTRLPVCSYPVPCEQPRARPATSPRTEHYLAARPWGGVSGAHRPQPLTCARRARRPRRAHLRVHSLHVRLQVPLLREGSRTEGTGVRLFTRVLDHVRLQRPLLVKGFPALAALEGPFTCRENEHTQPSLHRRHYPTRDPRPSLQPGRAP